VKDLIKEELIRFCHCFGRRANGSGLLLIGFRICGTRNVQATKHCSIPRAGYRVAARAGSRHLEIHSSGRASQEITKRIGGYEPAASDENGSKLAFADQDVKRTAR
jgi:hypothetical protein